MGRRRSWGGRRRRRLSGVEWLLGVLVLGWVAYDRIKEDPATTAEATALIDAATPVVLERGREVQVIAALVAALAVLLLVLIVARRMRAAPRRSIAALIGLGGIALAVAVTDVLPALPRAELALGGVALLACGGSWIGLRALRRRRYREQLRAIRIAGVDQMSGAQFENYVAELLRHAGYGVSLVGASGDQGADLILTRRGRRIACQVKRYSRPVSNTAVQEAVAAMAYWRCDAAMVVTNSRLTRGARELAEANGCEVVERRELGELIESFRAGRRSRAPR